METYWSEEKMNEVNYYSLYATKYAYIYGIEDCVLETYFPDVWAFYSGISTSYSQIITLGVIYLVI